MQKRTEKDTKKEKWGRLSKEFSYQGKKPRAPSECSSEPEQVRNKIRHLADKKTTYRGITNSVKHLSDKKQPSPERTNKKIRHLAHKQTYRGSTNSIKHLSDKKQSLPERTKTSTVKK